MAIKAGSTYVPEMTRQLRRFRSLQEDLAGAALLYGADETVVADGIKIVPYTETARLQFVSQFGTTFGATILAYRSIAIRRRSAGGVRRGVSAHIPCVPDHSVTVL